MTLVSALRNVQPELLDVASFNSLIPEDTDTVSVLVTGGWSGGDTVWTFRRREVNPDGSANAQAHQWDFLAGAPAFDRVTASDSVTFAASPNWVDLSGSGHTPGPQFNPFPIDGTYVIGFGARITASGGGNESAVGVSINGADPTANSQAWNNNANRVSVSAWLTQGLNVNDNVKMMFIGTSGSTTFAERWMSILPVRVG